MIDIIILCVFIAAAIGHFIGILCAVCDLGDNISIIKFIKIFFANTFGGTVIGASCGAFGGILVHTIVKII